MSEESVNRRRQRMDVGRRLAWVVVALSLAVAADARCESAGLPNKWIDRHLCPCRDSTSWAGKFYTKTFGAKPAANPGEMGKREYMCWGWIGFWTVIGFIILVAFWWCCQRMKKREPAPGFQGNTDAQATVVGQQTQSLLGTPTIGYMGSAANAESKLNQA